MFSNVTGKVSGWLPSSLPSVSMPTVSIPGLRKTQTTDEANEAVVPEQAVEAQPVQVTEKDDDDRSRYVFEKFIKISFRNK